MKTPKSRRVSIEELELRDRLAKVAASAPGVVCSFRMRADGSVSLPYASEAIRDIYGVSPADVAEDFSCVLVNVPSDDLERVRESVAESARTMTQWRDEWRFIHPVKGERWIEGCSMPVREPDGSILWHGYIQDVTERKERDRHITELNALLTLITDGAEALISYIDAGGRYRMVNRGYERWFGRSADEIVGRTPLEVLGESAWRSVSGYVARAMAGEKAEFETELKYRDGTARWIHASYLPDIAADGRVRGIVVLVVDVTEHRRIVAELQRSRKQLVDLMARHDSIIEAERRHIAREVHDELGQLLTGMRLALSALGMRGDGARKADVAKTVRQMEGLVDEASSVVRRISSDLRPVLLEHGLLSALEGLATEFRNMTGIVCGLTISGEPRDVGTLPVTTVFRIMQESLTNIARHAQASAASVQLSYEPDRLRVLIQDDGRGFDVQSALGDGGGLGLFGMRERAIMVGGALDIESSVGSGTRLRLEVPLKGMPEQ